MNENFPTTEAQRQRAAILTEREAWRALDVLADDYGLRDAELAALNGRLGAVLGYRRSGLRLLGPEFTNLVLIAHDIATVTATD